MSHSRRNFVKTLTLASASAALLPTACSSNKDKKLTILHTNDVHSHIDPFPANDKKFGNKGGYARRAALVKKIRATEPNVILLDCGDIFQGTPYFNVFDGKLDISLMSKMKYDAATIGNHEFDSGAENLAERVKEAQFPFVCSNYDFTNSPLESLTKPYEIIKKGDLKIGIIGLGIKLQGLVDPRMCGNITYNNPIEVANRLAKKLKNDDQCDVVICISHLGYKYESDKVSDVEVATKSENIDVILGGHTHTFLDEPTIVTNLNQEPVIINQAGWGGVKLGRIDLTMHAHKKSKTLAYHKMV